MRDLIIKAQRQAIGNACLACALVVEGHQEDGFQLLYLDHMNFILIFTQ